MNEGFRVHIIIPRVDPQRVGLSTLYQRIKDTEPHAGVARHLVDEELSAMHPRWLAALRMLAREGFVEWRVSHRVEDLPKTQFGRRSASS